MHILILGGCGFLGQHMTAALQKNGYTVVSTSRRGRHTHTPLYTTEASHCQHTHWDGFAPQTLIPLLTECNVVINLIGENIGQKRWTKARKKSILASRLNATQALTSALIQMKKESIPLPEQVIQASACGYYGVWNHYLSAPTCTEKTLRTAQSAQTSYEIQGLGKGFLSDVCAQWEEASTPIKELGVPICTLRLAPVLGHAWSEKTPFNPQNALPQKPCKQAPLAGFLRSMIRPFYYNMGGVVGSGNQPMSWVHVDDVAHSLLHILQRKSEGVYNICSPHPESMQHFVNTLGNLLQKPTFFRVPDMAARLLLGEMADELILKGQKCLPQRLLKEQYTFRHAKLASALKACLCLEEKLQNSQQVVSQHN